MPAVALPRLIEEKIADLGLQVRRLWVYRGISRVIILSLLVAIAAILVDRWVHFSSSARWLVTLSWFGFVAFASWWLILLPFRRRLSNNELAVAIESHFPSLSERLTTLVELSQSRDFQGSKPLLDLLVRDTAQRTKRLDFERAAPQGPALRGALVAGVLIGLALSSLVFVSGGAARMKRFLLPWYTPPVEVPFIIKVSSGNVVVKRGEPVTLTAYLERKQPEVALPTVVTLLAKDAASQQEKKLPMSGDASAAFHVTWPAIASSIEYRVEAGGLVSDAFTVTVTDPVNLTEGTTTIITPPQYATPPLLKQSLAGFATIEGLQHSDVELLFKFERPAQSVMLEFQPATGGMPIKDRYPMTLSDDRRQATANVVLESTGSLKLTVTGEHGVVTTQSVPVRAVLDAAPRFERAGGISGRAKSVKPGETIILELTVQDDLKVEKLELEYRVNQGQPVTIPLPLKDVGTPRVDGKYVFSLTGLVKEGDTLFYRLKAQDNRRVAGLTPQMTYFPEKDWAKLDITESADSLEQQEILAARDAIQKKLDEASREANEARKRAEQVARESGEKPMLTPEQLGRLQESRAAAARSLAALEEAAKDATLTPELRALADAIRVMAIDTVKSADEQLRRAEHEPSPKNRAGELTDAEKKLVEARERIEELMKRNSDLARNRLDKRRLEKLAAEVEKLAAEAEKATDPAAKQALLDKLTKAKAELAEIIKGNDALRNGAENAANDEARKLTNEAEKLKEWQNRVAAEVAKAEAEARKKALADSAKMQDELNAKARALGDKTVDPAKLTGAEPLSPRPFDAASDKLHNGDAIGAMTEQEKAARELDRLAEALEKAVKERLDPREAARQLAKLQDDLRQKLTEALKKPMTDADRKSFTDRQELIRKATDRLETPPESATSGRDKAEALARLAEASEAVAGNPAEAADSQKAAAAALRAFADRLPSRNDRLAAGALVLAGLMREQDDLAVEIEAKLKLYERRKPDEATVAEVKDKLAVFVKRQERLMEKLGAVDTPGFQGRRDRAVATARKAVEDLKTGRPLDIPASQLDLKRKLIQLRTALNGGIPSDAVADELSQIQKRLHDRLTVEVVDKGLLTDVHRIQKEIHEKLVGLNDPDGGERLLKARAVTAAALDSFKVINEVDDVRTAIVKALAAVNDLADHLAGVEAERARVARLAKSRRERADWSKANAGKPAAADIVAQIASELERDLDDLKRTRVGFPQVEKKAAIDSLEKLRKTPNAERAFALQQEAAEALEALLKRMPESNEPGGERNSNDGDSSGDAGGQLPSKQDAEAARQLAAEQRAARDKAARANGGAQPDAETMEKLKKEQEELARQANDLAKRMDKASQNSSNGEPSANKLAEASEAAKKAGEQMDKANREQAAGRGGSAADARAEAGKALEDAKAKAGAAAGTPGQAPDAKAAEASKKAEEANGHLRDAGKEPGQAAKPLKKAAEKISEAADKLGEAGQPQGGNNGAEKKPAAAFELPPDLQQYAGKPWGDLPGDVKARIIQDLKAKYGEDYARVIKLYFEQLAEKK